MGILVGGYLGRGGVFFFLEKGVREVFRKVILGDRSYEVCWEFID